MEFLILAIILKVMCDYFCKEMWCKVYHVGLDNLSTKPSDLIEKVLKPQNIVLKKLLIYDEKLKVAHYVDQVI